MAIKMREKRNSWVWVLVVLILGYGLIRMASSPSEDTDSDSLPGWDLEFTQEEISEVMALYADFEWSFSPVITGNTSHYLLVKLDITGTFTYNEWGSEITSLNFQCVEDRLELIINTEHFVFILPYSAAIISEDYDVIVERFSLYGEYDPEFTIDNRADTAELTFFLPLVIYFETQ